MNKIIDAVEKEIKEIVDWAEGKEKEVTADVKEVEAKVESTPAPTETPDPTVVATEPSTPAAS